MKVLGNLEQNKTIFFAPHPPTVQKNVLAPLTVPIADATHLFFTFCVRALGTLATHLLVVNEKTKKFS